MNENIEKQRELHELTFHDNETMCVYITTQSRYEEFKSQDLDDPDTEDDPDGLWLDLETFDSYDELVKFAEEIFSDEDNPTFLFWDCENFPSDDWFNENSLEEIFPKIVAYNEYDDNYKEAFRDYVAYFKCDDFNDFDDRYRGRYDSEEDFAREEMASFMDMDKELGNLSVYFDWERYTKDLFSDYEMSKNGHVFSLF